MFYAKHLVSEEIVKVVHIELEKNFNVTHNSITDSHGTIEYSYSNSAQFLYIDKEGKFKTDDSYNFSCSEAEMSPVYRAMNE